MKSFFYWLGAYYFVSGMQIYQFYGTDFDWLVTLIKYTAKILNLQNSTSAQLKRSYSAIIVQHVTSSLATQRR